MKFESMSVQIKELIAAFESIAPFGFQESYDNSGLLVGHSDTWVSKALLCLDCTPEIVAEAKDKGCDVIVAHHPIVFSGLKRFNGNNYVERAVISAIKNDIAILAVHTNLDNVLHFGVNQKIAHRLELSQLRILDPKESQLFKLVVYVPKPHTSELQEALFLAGAGRIGNYDECAFTTEGMGSFRPLEGANPFEGIQGERHVDHENKLEVLVDSSKIAAVIQAMKQVHPYEEVAYDLIKLENIHQEVGAGIVGELKAPLSVEAFLDFLKEKMELSVVKHTVTNKTQIKTVALCGGAGSFLIKKALKQADAYITSDIKYHEFFDAEGELLLCDIGHYESEKYTIQIFADIISKKIPNFATIFAQTLTNPVQYR